MSTINDLSSLDQYTFVPKIYSMRIFFDTKCNLPKSKNYIGFERFFGQVILKALRRKEDCKLLITLIHN